MEAERSHSLPVRREPESLWWSSASVCRPENWGGWWFRSRLSPGAGKAASERRGDGCLGSDRKQPALPPPACALSPSDQARPQRGGLSPSLSPLSPKSVSSRSTSQAHLAAVFAQLPVHPSAQSGLHKVDHRGSVWCKPHCLYKQSQHRQPTFAVRDNGNTPKIHMPSCLPRAILPSRPSWRQQPAGLLLCPVGRTEEQVGISLVSMS